MEYQSSLDNSRESVVADTSVIINLIATSSIETILGVLPNKCLVVEEVMLELEAGWASGKKDADKISELSRENHIEIVRLENDCIGYFEELVSGPSVSTLDDGEAATIAYAADRGLIALIDESKGERISQQRFGDLQVATTVDILSHRRVQTEFGRDKLADVVFNALYDGRMRVRQDQLAWITGLIGAERASQCISLPRHARNN